MLSPPTLSRSFFFQAEDGIRDYKVPGVQTCALPIYSGWLIRRFFKAKCGDFAGCLLVHTLRSYDVTGRAEDTVFFGNGFPSARVILTGSTRWGIGQIKPVKILGRRYSP